MSKMKIVGLVVFVMLIAAPLVAAPSLPVTKPPVQPVPSWTGPQQDPHAQQGQWFQRPDGTEEVRTHEFYDNVQGSGGGASSSLAIMGVAQNVVHDLGTGNIVSFDILATITNDAPASTYWQGGNNSHNEYLYLPGNPEDQYEGTFYDTKLTASFAIDPLVGPPPAGIPYTDIVPHIIAINHEQLGWYCWSPENPEPSLVPWGSYYVPTWDFGNIGPGQSVTKTMSFTVDGGGLPPADPRFMVIEMSQGSDQDILLNRTTSLKISNWLDTVAMDWGVPYPGGPAGFDSDVSVFHNITPNQCGLSLDIRKPPVNPVPSWTGPTQDPHAQQGQWFYNPTTETEEVRTHEFYDPSWPIAPGVLFGWRAIKGVVDPNSIVYDPSSGNIKSFNIVATITNKTPWPFDWEDGSNRHGETLSTLEQYHGPLLKTKLVAEFAIASGLPPPGSIGPYRDETFPHIKAVNHDQLAWYCWTPQNPEPNLVPWGSYYVPTWDFGDIAQGASATRTLQFTVGGAGLPSTDIRFNVIISSAQNGDDVLLNRTTSLKISTWIDDLYKDDGSPYPQLVDPGLPLRGSDCSVFHNIKEEEELWGGLSLDIRKPPVQPNPSWTGPGIDPHAVQGQWFADSPGMQNPQVRTHEFYDPVNDNAGSNAISGYVTSITYDAVTPNNIVAFDIQATIYNGTPWPYEWADGSNSHGETLSTDLQYAGPLVDAILTADFAIKTIGWAPPANAWPPYRQTDPYIYSLNEDYLAWYCWSPAGTQGPFGNYTVPGWNFGTIPQGGWVSRTLRFGVFGNAGGTNGMPPGDIRYNVIVNSFQNSSDVLLNRETSLKISTWVDDLYNDDGSPYPGPPLRGSDVSVFHNILQPLDGPSLDIRKPPVQPVPSWTGPQQDPDAIRGQWFNSRFGPTGAMSEWPRSHEFYDDLVTSGGGFNSTDGIRGVVTVVQYDASGLNIVYFEIQATITNYLGLIEEWYPGTNSHLEFRPFDQMQYIGPMWATELTGSFAIDPVIGFPFSGSIGVYRDTIPHIVALNHDRLGWYCWTPENPMPERQPWGGYFVPTWDFGYIPAGASVSRTLKFQVDGGGLPQADPRFAAIVTSNGQGTDILLNRTSSLKISDWLDDLLLDTGLAYPEPPLKGSDCSVFHNLEPVPITVTPTLDWNWVYQNTLLTTQWRHVSKLTIGLDDPNGNTTYAVTVTQNPASVGKVVIQAGVNALNWDILGGDKNVPDPVGIVILDVSVTGNEVGGTGSGSTTIDVRFLGDIEGDGDVDASDKAQMNKRLNSLPVVYPDRAFDLEGDNDVDASDKVVINKLLNSLPIP